MAEPRHACSEVWLQPAMTADNARPADAKNPGGDSGSGGGSKEKEQLQQRLVALVDRGGCSFVQKVSLS